MGSHECGWLESRRSHGGPKLTATLTVCTITGSSSEQLEAWIHRVLDYADEVVVMVDAASPGATLEVARAYADKVELFEHPNTPEEIFDRLLRHASCDWILRLDDDEIMNRGFPPRLQDLLAEQRVTHYMLARRWLVPGAGDGDYAWIRQSPWYPDPCFRLMQNVDGLFRHPPVAHSHTEILGEGRLLDDDEACIYHMDLVWKTRQQREEKVRSRYGTVSSYTAEEYYLYEGQVDGRDLVPVPEGEIVSTPGPRALSQLERRRSTTARFEPSIARLDEIVLQAEARSLDNALAGEVIDGDIFAADVNGHETPAVLQPNRGYLCRVSLRNRSGGRWRCSGELSGRVMLSYHWMAADGSVVTWDGRRSFLPNDVLPGAEVTVAAGLVAPGEAGLYTLQWDLVCEGVSWFGERGTRLPTARVEVVAS